MIILTCQLTNFPHFLGEELLHFHVSMRLKVKDSKLTEGHKGVKVKKKEVKFCECYSSN